MKPTRDWWTCSLLHIHNTCSRLWMDFGSGQQAGHSTQKKTLATKSFFKDFGKKVFFVAKITLPIEAEFSSCFAAILFCCEAPETLCGLKKLSSVSPPIKPKVNTNKKLFYSLSILLLHRLFNISMSPCCKYCPDGGQPLLMLKKKKERWSFNIHADFFMAGLCTVQACLLRRLKLFSPREGMQPLAV